VATKTLGTSATTTLTAIGPFTMAYSEADVGTISNDILDDLNVAHPIIYGSFSIQGQLFIPNRGVLRVLPGDWVGVDPNGWPILVSKNSIAGSGWTHS
jgi:hypothetical protein